MQNLTQKLAKWILKLKIIVNKNEELRVDLKQMSKTLNLSELESSNANKTFKLKIELIEEEVQH